MIALASRRAPTLAGWVLLFLFSNCTCVPSVTAGNSENDDVTELPKWARIGTNKLAGHAPPGAGFELLKGNMRAIAISRQILYVQLNGVWIDEDGLSLIAESDHIKGLSFHQTNLSDNGVEKLSLSKTVEHLNFCDAVLSRRSLESIAKMKQLKSLSLNRCHFIREKDVRAFRKLRPDVTLEADVLLSIPSKPTNRPATDEK